MVAPEESSSRSAPWPLVAVWVTLALGYLLLGQLALLLAIPPGYATAVFPPAGLALHQTLRRGPSALPGVWLGSFLMNLSVAWKLGHRPGLVVMAALIALGAVLQAWVGALLARRHADDPLAMRTPRQLTAVLALGGTVACLIGATVGMVNLHLLADLPRSALPFAGWTWYVGDLIGVVLTVPFLEMARAPRGSLWGERRMKVGLPLLLSSTAVIALFVRVSHSETEALRLNLRLRGEQVRNELSTSIQSRLEILQALQGLLEAVPDLDQKGFERFVGPYLGRHRDLHSLDWARRVPGPERAAFEARLSAQLGVPSPILESDPGRQVRRAAEREEYWPVTFKHPLDLSRSALGLDLRTRPYQAARMFAAREAGLPGLIILEGLVQDPVPRPAMILTLPIYAGGGIPATPQDRIARHRGFFSVLFYVDPILEDIDARTGRGEVALRLQIARTDGLVFEGGRTSLPPSDGGPKETFPFDLLGNQALLEVTPSQAHRAGHTGWQVFLVLAGGLSVTGMLGALLLLVSAQVHEARGLAEHRGRTLADLEARAKVILDHAVEPILTLDATGAILAANTAAERLFGWPVAHLQGRPITEFVPGLLTHLRHAESTGSIREATGFPRVGEPIPLEVGLNAVVLDQETLFTAFLRDLRDRRRVERLKNEFIAVVSHELRTPLTSIRGTLGLLQGGVAGPLPERAGSLVHIAHDNAVRLGRLVDDILDLEKLEQGKLRLARHVAALGPLLEESLEAVRGTADREGIQLILSSPLPTGARALVDGGRLVQVLANLLSNAIKHSPRGATVQLRMHQTEDHWRIEVVDQGPGVPEAFQGQLFEKFTQADPSEDRVVQGTGLGLAIARSLVERMEGRIGFENPPGGGACFYVELPVA